MDKKVESWVEQNAEEFKKAESILSRSRPEPRLNCTPMTMTETKVSDEEIQGLIERLEEKKGDGPGTRRHYELAEIIDALRQLQAENKALREQKRKQHDSLCMAKECMTVIYSDPDGNYYMNGDLSDDIDAIDAALQQEKGDG